MKSNLGVYKYLVYLGSFCLFCEDDFGKESCKKNHIYSNIKYFQMNCNQKAIKMKFSEGRKTLLQDDFQIQIMKLLVHLL